MKYFIYIIISIICSICTVSAQTWDTLKDIKEIKLENILFVAEWSNGNVSTPSNIYLSTPVPDYIWNDYKFAEKCFTANNATICIGSILATVGCITYGGWCKIFKQ